MSGRNQTPEYRAAIAAAYAAARRGEVVSVPLTRGKIALIDAVDAARILPLKWHACKGKGGLWYAQHGSRHAGTYARMHQMVLGVVPNGRATIIDHINHDGLDNRRLNLRVVSNSTNSQNRRNGRGKSGYLGVVARKHAKRPTWSATAYSNGKHIHLGDYYTPEEAARVYDAKVIELHGLLARVNFAAEGVNVEQLTAPPTGE